MRALPNGVPLTVRFAVLQTAPWHQIGAPERLGVEAADRNGFAAWP